MPPRSCASQPIKFVLVITLILLNPTTLTIAQDDAVFDAQRTLSKLGYDPGPADGLMGPRTKLALRSFQSDEGLEATGLLDPPTSKALARSLEMAPPSSAPISRAENGSWWPWIVFIIAAYGVVRLFRRGRHGRWGLAIGGVIGFLISGPVGALVGAAIGFIVGDVVRKSGSAVARKDTRNTTARRTTAGSVLEARKATKSVVRWIEPDGTATVAGREIGGMIYLGSGSRRDSWKTEGSPFIDPRLPVARIGSDFAGDSLPYWPSYVDLSPPARATYLDWLAGGRSDQRIGPGYVFLYFYGLERRFFVDSPTEQEKRLLITEVERLLGLYGENRSVRRYLSTFLDTARIVLKPASESEPRFEKSNYELPLGLRIAIGRMAKAAQPLSADWLLNWYIAHPETRFRAVLLRAFPEFRAQFNLLFDEQFPRGLKIRTPKRLLRTRYTAASGAFEVDLNSFLGDIPDISGTSKPLTIAKELVEKASEALDKYSRFLGRNPDGRDTIEAHALLPERLWLLFPCAEMEDLRGWAEEIIEKGGFAPVEHVIEQLEGTPPEKMSKRQLIGAADALARLSIGMAPDPRFALRSPKLGEPVVLFRLPEEITALEEVSDKYKDILVTIAMGSFVANADGAIAARERSALQARVDAARLSGAERARLLANLQWMLAIPPDLALFRRRLKDVPEKALRELSQVALAMAAADGVIDPGEIKAIERLYKTMGLTMDGMYSALHALTTGTEPIAVRPEFQPTVKKTEPTTLSATESCRYAIPKNPYSKPGSVIDAVYDVIKKAGGTATGLMVVDQVASFIQPRTGRPHGRSASLRTIRWMVKNSRLDVVNRREPVTVRPSGDQERDFTIPLPPESDSKVVLDTERIASVMANTARVSSVLGDIFGDDEPEEDPEETAEDPKSNFPGLDAQHAAFLGELLTQPRWEEAEFATLASQFRLMQAGALETLNEWSFDRFGDMLIEEYEGYEVNPDIEAEFRN